MSNEINFEEIQYLEVLLKRQEDALCLSAEDLIANMV